MKTFFRRLVTALAETAFLAVIVCLTVACDPNVSITSPINGNSIDSLSVIQGTYNDADEVRLFILRYEDGKFWTGSSWGGSASAILPTSLNTSSTWQSTGPLPSGGDLTPGYYDIIAIAVSASNNKQKRTDSVVRVGITAPPLTTALFSWGDGANLGAGPGHANSNQPIPVNQRGVLEGKAVVSISAGFGGFAESLASTIEGRVYSWTSNPVEVSKTGALAGQFITQVTAGSRHLHAVTQTNQTAGWGTNREGELGDNNPTGNSLQSVPAPVSPVSTPGLDGKCRMIAAGDAHTAFVTTEGKVFTCGENSFGNLGNGNNTNSPVPVAVTSLDSEFVEAASAHDDHTLVVTRTGKVYAFGNNVNGQLGNGSQTSSNVPVQAGVTGDMAGKFITAIAAGSNHSLALDSDGHVYGWGTSFGGAVGTGDSGAGAVHTVPVLIGGGLTGRKVTLIAAGSGFSFAVTSDNKVFSWGSNLDGELAGATAIGTNALVPTEADFSAVFASGRRIQAIDCGDDFGLVLASPAPMLEPEIEVSAQGSELVDGGPAGINFGAQSYGASVPVWVSVRNTGNADLADLEAWIDGPDGFDYWTIYTPAPVAPNMPPSGFYVFFQPFGNGNPAPTTHTATLRIKSNDADENTFDIPLTGTGYPAAQPEAGFTAASAGYHIDTTVVQPDGKILLGGSFTSLQPKGSAAPADRKNIGRLNADGTLDTSFRPDAFDRVRCIALQRDNKILIGGQFNSLQPGGTGTIYTRNYLARLNPDGTVDTGFVANLNGLVRGILPLADGRILICGQFTNVNNGSGAEPRNRIALLNENGTPDPSFIPNANGEVLTMALDRSNRLYVAGYFSGIGGATRYNVARLDMNDGTADDFTTVQSAYVYALAIDSDGAVLMGGDFVYPLPGGGSVSNMIRVMSNSAIDEFWRPNPGYNVHGISVQADGKLLVSGSFTTVKPHPDVTTTERNRMARFHSNGSLDTSFDPNFNNDVYGAAIQADGKIVPAGSFTTVGGQTLAGTARLSNSAVTNILTIPSPSYIQWERGGAAPETTDVWFDLSTDAGMTWTPLSGGISRSPTGWQMTGASLPSVGHVRARARTVSGHHQGSSGVVEKIAAIGEPPDISVTESGAAVASGSNYDFGAVKTGSQADVRFVIANTGPGLLSGLRSATLEDDPMHPGDDLAHFELARPGSDSLTTGADTSLYVTFKPKAPLMHKVILHIVSNDPDESPIDISLQGFAGEPITTWRERYFDETADAGSGGDNADPDGDGITNIEEYARGLDPLVNGGMDLTISFGGTSGGFAADTVSIPDNANLGPGGGTFFFNYSRNKLSLADIVFQVEWSDTLGENDWHTTGVSEAVISETGDIQQVQATVPAGTADRRFVRLKMTRP